MSDSNTATYSLIKPLVGASGDTWGAKLNANFDKIDELFDGTLEIKPDLAAGEWSIDTIAVTANANELNRLTVATEGLVESGKVLTATENLNAVPTVTFGSGAIAYFYNSIYAGSINTIDNGDSTGTFNIGTSGADIKLDVDGTAIATVSSTGVEVDGDITSTTITYGTTGEGGTQGTITATAAELNLLDGITNIYDNDNLLPTVEEDADSATSLATQESIKAYVDTAVAAQTGEVLQVVSAVTSSNATYTDTDLEPTDLYVDITPISTTSKFLVTVNIHVGPTNDNYVGLGIQRKIDNQVADDIGNPTTGTGNRRNAIASAGPEGGYFAYTPANVSYQYLDTASGFTGDDTSIRYTATVSNRSGHTTHLNKGYASDNAEYVIFTISTITVTEIAG
jgi:hypothetical protein